MARMPRDDFYLSGEDSVIGDTEIMYGRMVGGADNFYGEDDQDYYSALGDAVEMHDKARGGADDFYGGANVGNGEDGIQFVGDAAYMYDNSAGGRDYIEGGYNSDNELSGDAIEAYDEARGGGDEIVGGSSGNDGYGMGAEAHNIIVGDAEVFGNEDVRIARPILTPDLVQGGADRIYGGDAYSVVGWAYTSNAIAGDAREMYSLTKGGNDVISGGDAYYFGPPGEDGYGGHVDNAIVGDAEMMAEGSMAGNDTITGGGTDAYGTAFNAIIGDAFVMFDESGAGDDHITGGSSGISGEDGYGGGLVGNYLVGDVHDDYRYASQFGDDTIVGGSGTGEDGYSFVENIMFGDLGSDGALSYMVEEYAGEDLYFPEPGFAILGRGEFAYYGDDSLVGGDFADNFMMGDAEYIGYGQGGDDTLVGGGWGSENRMYGDGFEIGEDGFGGNDVLVSGRGEDMMWGDAGEDDWGNGGADHFVFNPYNGQNDVIMDFDPDEGDHIMLRSFRKVDRDGFRPVNFFEERLSETGEGVWVDLSFNEESAGHGVLLVGVTLEELGRSSFLL